MRAWPVVVLLAAMAGACSGDTPSSPTASGPTVCPNAPPRATYTLNSNETLRVMFRVANNPDANILVTNVGLAQGVSGDTWSLFDGSSLLGTQTPLANIAFWDTATNPSPITATVIDFSAIQGGTIDGRLEFAVASGPVQLDLTQLNIGSGVGDSSFSLRTTGFGAINSLALVSSACH